jgi:hypothetical protein
MLKKRAKNKGSADLGAPNTFEIHFFLPGQGFRAVFYSAESKELALGLFKAEFPGAQAFWIAPARGKALAGLQTQYLVWWKSYGGPDWEPHMVFVLDSEGNLLGSVPNVGSDAASLSFNLATRRIAEGNKAHRLEQVDESMASLIGNEIYVKTARNQDQILRDWHAGKFDDLEIEPGLEAEA